MKGKLHNYPKVSAIDQEVLIITQSCLVLTSESGKVHKYPKVPEIDN